MRTTREKKVCSVGTTTTCMRVVLPHPPPPIIRIRGKPKSLGNLRKVATVAHGLCLPLRCTRQACSTDHICNVMQSICSSLNSNGFCGFSLTLWMSFQATCPGPRRMSSRGKLMHCSLSLASFRARSCNKSFKSRFASSSTSVVSCARINLGV